MTERPGTWQRVRTNAGWHLRFIGANGEPVLTSEVYTRPETVENAIHLAIRTALDNVETDHIVTVAAADDLARELVAALIVDVDERGTGPGPHTTTLKARIAAILDDAYDPDDYGLRLDQIRTIIQD